MNRIRVSIITLTAGLAAVAGWLDVSSAPPRAVEAAETEEKPPRIVTLAYTVNNFGYTDTCG